MEFSKLMIARRTYWHLEANRRVPSEYEIATTKLLYYRPERGHEVCTPAGQWQRRLELASELRVSDWDSFRDPRETTYASYVARQKDKEVFVDGLFRSMAESNYDRGLSPRWIDALGALLPVLRFPCHALQMTAAFLGQTAPASSVIVACSFQVGDEIRRIERLAYRMRQLQEVDPAFGTESRLAWQSRAEWQPLRRLVETLLVTYDFGEAFVASNLALKPIFDDLVALGLARLAEANGDPLLGRLLFSLSEDSAWHRDYSSALVRFAVKDRVDNRALVEGWLRHWQEPVQAAARALAPLFGDPEFHALAEFEERRAKLWHAAGTFGGPLS
jgi:toluene monooxygenase system protein E